MASRFQVMKSIVTDAIACLLSAAQSWLAYNIEPNRWLVGDMVSGSRTQWLTLMLGFIRHYTVHAFPIQWPSSRQICMTLQASRVGRLFFSWQCMKVSVMDIWVRHVVLTQVLTRCERHRRSINTGIAPWFVNNLSVRLILSTVSVVTFPLEKLRHWWICRLKTMEKLTEYW